MDCRSPIIIYESVCNDANIGKKVRSLRAADLHGLPYETVEVGCGRCLGCRLRKKYEWMCRLLLESTRHSEMCFVTLTYAPEFVDPYKSLVIEDAQRFMKRLRKHFAGSKVLYYVVGEYGSLCLDCGRPEYVHWKDGSCRWRAGLGRPHFHILLYGVDFPDRVWDPVAKMYVSSDLARLWPFGRTSVGGVEPASVGYCAGYCTKKITGAKAVEHYVQVDCDSGEQWSVEPEFFRASSRPAIGRGWIEANEFRVYADDCIDVLGKRFRIPGYFDRLYDIADPGEMEVVKALRRDRARRRAGRSLTQEERVESERRLQERHNSKVRRYEQQEG